jgi:flavin-dependent dehydrogenase
MPSSESFDVIIIGGGPAGAAAAITLAVQGIRTAIIERSDYSTPRVGETLPPAIRSTLISLGVWQRFLEDGHIESFAIRSAWGTPQLRDSVHIYNPYGSGWHVDRTRFDRMLVTAASNAGALLLIQARIMNLSHDRTSDWQVAILQHRRSRYLHASFLIDATGRTAAIRVGLPRSFNVVDRLIGVVRFFAGVAEPYILIEADAYGWWYSAPLPHDRLVVAHMTDADLFAVSDCSPYYYWHRQLAEAPLTSARIGQETPLTKLKIVSAASLIRSPICGTDWLAAGDASVAFDPLSGRGVYNALKGGIFAAKAVTTRFAGNNEAFTEYSEWINSQFSNYLQMRSAFYSKEQRWPHSPFWRRRHTLSGRYRPTGVSRTAGAGSSGGYYMG